ncbi:hypothetical protein [Methylobacterium nonmethylotrophicum]|uniref:Uncharacterized protein n=1 Tax=Methylobacterium nonmethylotrophicum TaxID=1141884 RepID=A0A4Z0NVK6_9HYPH|nr:hypothetical protein [Methylobacterium nonmethylotrophicum]TGE01753.1 hypothetical protein EU555_03515 [Methylobacterium nonmethylotrophicum]
MLLLVVLIVWTPAILLAVALILARLTGCEVNEARSNPCRVAGLDIGGLLHTMMVTGWLVIPLLPVMALTLIGGVVAGGLALFGIWRP